METTIVAQHVAQVWDTDVLPALDEYIRIPNQSPMFDPAWAEVGHMERATELIRRWIESRPIENATVAVERIEGRTPLIVAEVDPAGGGDATDTVLLYGHLDKQPPLDGWREGLGPWTPVRVGDRLYGRGGADDGYAAFAAVSALEAVRVSGGAHARAVVLVEASEESGSPDLPAYIDALADRIGSPSLVVCLDSFCASYDRMWLTTSLRGLLGLDVTVDVLATGVHSGQAGGVVPSSFRVLRQLLDRVEDPGDGRILVDELHAAVPPEREAQIARAAADLGELAGGSYPLLPGVRRRHDGDFAAQLRARTWEPTLEIVGMDGIPSTVSAGNVLRASTTAKLSFRLPPTVDPDVAAAAVTKVLAADPPDGARVTVTTSDVGAGWNASPTAPWLEAAFDEASRAAFGQPAAAMGEGGTIPFMAMLGERFPEAQFMIVGVLGPESNAHGPNEFLDIPMAKGITTAVAHVLDAHARRLHA